MILSTIPRKVLCQYAQSEYTKKFDVPSFKINGETIQEVDHVTYLGHFVSNTLRDDNIILRQCQQLNGSDNMILRKGYMCSIEMKLPFLILSALLCILLSCVGITQYQVYMNFMLLTIMVFGYC